ncbi:hypothetical protein HY641_03430 [Candidatus Woesearchaeota archaeon]|nr:hypothetical protein [Candidatus Woesearchaeota archaeon]
MARRARRVQSPKLSRSLKTPQEYHVAALATLLVLITGIVAVFVITHSQTTVGYLLAIPKSVDGTIIIAGLNLNDFIGTDVQSVTGLELRSLGTQRITTRRGSTNVFQTLRFRSTSQSTFDGGKIVFEEDEDGSVGDFLKWRENTPLFELEHSFGSGIQGLAEDGVVRDFEDASLPMLGKEYIITKVTVNTASDRINIRMFGDIGEIEFEDSDYSDSDFERGVKINGRTVNALIMVRAVETGSEIRIISMKYRPLAFRRSTGDVRVIPSFGVRGQLREPQTLLSSSFDIIYGGLGGLPGAGGSSERSISGSGNEVRLRPRGGDRYSLLFTNTRGTTYDVPLVELQDSTLVSGESTRRFVVKEADNSASFNINEGDYFALTSRNDINGVTTIMRLSRVDYDQRQVFVDDLSGGSKIVVVNDAGEGSLISSGGSFQLFADPGGSRKIAVDQTGDGTVDGTRAKLVVLGGAMLEPSSSSLVLRIDEDLFRESDVTSDETVTITFTNNNGDIDVSIPSTSTLRLQRGSDDLKRGITPFGVIFTVDDDNAPSLVSMDIPRGQRGATVTVTPSLSTRGQRQGFVVVTTERQRFLQ